MGSSLTPEGLQGTTLVTDLNGQKDIMDKVATAGCCGNPAPPPRCSGGSHPTVGNLTDLDLLFQVYGRVTRG